ncbi:MULTISPECIES: hypothetical protein [Bacillus]|uniref:hypothetical protein n=1 Tax=Bacillus TaxID=1386 RepID=UPI00159B939D|nr:MULTISPECIES: hypothetical protein [Bacillus]
MEIILDLYIGIKGLSVTFATAFVATCGNELAKKFFNKKHKRTAPKACKRKGGSKRRK